MRFVPTARSSALAAAFALAFAFAPFVPGASAGDAEPAARLPWDGFAVGSSVHQRTTTTMSVEGVPPQTSETRQTLVKVTDDAYTIQHETKVGDAWMGMELPFPRRAAGAAAAVEAPKLEALGDEDVTVDGKAYPCKKVRSVFPGGATTTWRHATEGVLKFEMKGPGVESSTLVTRLAVTVKAGDRELEARASVRTSKGSGTEIKVTTWTSSAVPGGTVRSEMVTEMPGMKTTVVTETIAFQGK